MAQPEGMSTTKNFHGVRHPSDTYVRVVERNRSRGDRCELPVIVRNVRGKGVRQVSDTLNDTLNSAVTQGKSRSYRTPHSAGRRPEAIRTGQ